MDNFAVVVNKEEGITSRDVVNKLNRIFHTKKIGHTGTLDPLASGVLLCLVGKYTKLANIITSEEKTYIATIKLGIKTDTLDIEGTILEKEEVKDISSYMVEEVLNSLKGKFRQTIPLYSAKHVNGKRLYEYARGKEEVILPENEVMIYDLELLSMKELEIKFMARVSKGTYIRSLIEVICNKLNVSGVMSSLKRIKQGNFDIENAYSIEDISKGNFKKLKITDILDVKVIDLEKEEELYKKVSNGNILKEDISDGYVLYKNNKEEIALYQFLNKEGKLLIKIKE